MALRFSPARGAASFALSTAIRGPVGAPGNDGLAATVNVGAVTVLAPGSPPTVVNSGSSAAATLDFGLPATPTIAVGATVTKAAGSSATAANSGTSTAQVYDFGIPRGADAGLRYAFESSTAMAAPAVGGLRLNNASLASVTAIAVNAVNSDAIDVSDFIATWDDSTNPVKGYIEVRKEGSGAVLGLYALTSVADNSTWLQFAVTYKSGSGSFTATDSLYLTPYLIGNAGTNGTVAVSGTPTVNQLAAWTDATTVKGVSITGLVKGNGASAPTAAVAGTDYIGPTSGSAIQKASSGGLTAAVAGTDYLAPAAIGSAVQAYDAQLFSNIPQNAQSAAYTLVATDAQKCIYHPSADTTARIWTVPANASVAFPVGTVITLDNDFGAGAITVVITSDTLVLVGASGSTGSRTLASGGQAVLMKVGATRWRISGAGLT